MMSSNSFRFELQALDGEARACRLDLFHANESFWAILASMHNVRFYQRLVGTAREAIREGRFDDWRAGLLEEYRPG